MYVMIVISAIALQGAPNGIPFQTQGQCDQAADIYLHQLPVEIARQVQVMCAPQGNIRY